MLLFSLPISLLLEELYTRGRWRNYWNEVRWLEKYYALELQEMEEGLWEQVCL